VNEPAQVLEVACHQLGLNCAPAELIRAAENTMYRLPGAIVARVTRAGQFATAGKEVRVSRWLRDEGVAVVEAVPGLAQPVRVGSRAVTFWRELPEHHAGSIDQIADVLHALHRLTPPRELNLPPLAPFVRLRERIAEAAMLDGPERSWLLEHLGRLEHDYAGLPCGMPFGAVHGDAWGGNIVATVDGPVVLDLERFAFGPPEWDLVSIAVDHVTFGTLPQADWERFCARYGYDVIGWAGYEVLRDARELRKVTFALQMAGQYPHLTEQARYRLTCIQGRHGPRPWHWQAVP